MASRIEQANKLTRHAVPTSGATLDELGDDVVFGRTARCALPGKAGEYALVEVLGLR